MIKTNIYPAKNLFCPQTVQPGCKPGSAKIISAIRIFYFEGHSAWRCSVMRNVLWITIREAPVSILGEAELGCYATRDDILISTSITAVESNLRTSW